MTEALPMPPPELRFMGKTDEEFIRGGRHIVADLDHLVGIDTDDSVLDIGSGYGRFAWALWNTGHAGRYLGMDILPRHIRWCQLNMTPASHGRYQFLHLDIESSRYNKTGTVDGGEVRFDFEFRPDIVVATSVFTHMSHEPLLNYLRQIARVLTPGGHVMATFFLINSTQRSCEREGRSRYPLYHELTSFSRCWKDDDPLHVIAYEEEWIVEQVAAAGMLVEDVVLGSWCGRAGARVFQDTLVLTR